MSNVEETRVWKVVMRQEAEANSWKVVKTRWIDIDKGDKQHRNYRSRLVAKEFNDGAQDGFFPSTPPLEAIKPLLSDAATITDGVKQQNVVMINGMSRAFFEAPARRSICVLLPREAGGDAPQVGRLRMSLYGTRDAAAKFQQEANQFMQGCGFERPMRNPNVYWHRSRDIKTRARRRV